MVFSAVVMLTLGLGAEQPESPWRCNSHPCERKRYVLLWRRAAFFFEDLWQYVWFMRRISLSSFFLSYQGLVGLGHCHKGIWLQLSLFSLGHSVCQLVGLEQIEDELNGCGVGQSLNLRQGERWGTQRPSSARLSSMEMSCWPAICMRATSSSRRLWIPTLHMESPTSITLHCTMLPGTPWHAYSGQDVAQIKPNKQGSKQTECTHSERLIFGLSAVGEGKTDIQGLVDERPMCCATSFWYAATN